MTTLRHEVELAGSPLLVSLVVFLLPAGQSPKAQLPSDELEVHFGRYSDGWKHRLAYEEIGEVSVAVHASGEGGHV